LALARVALEVGEAALAPYSRVRLAERRGLIDSESRTSAIDSTGGDAPPAVSRRRPQQAGTIR
jgi:hypothetical protein